MIFSSLLLTLVATAQAGNIAEELTKMGATTLVDLVVKAGLADTLSNSGPFTVFAPDNDAFSRVPDSIMQALASDVELLKKVLLYHVVSGAIPSSAAENNVKLDSVQGAPILVNLYLKSDYYDVSFHYFSLEDLVSECLFVGFHYHQWEESDEGGRQG